MQTDRRVAIVTGTGSPTGIGRAAALALADDGLSVVVTDVATEPLPDGSPAANTEAMAALVAELEARGVEAMAVQVDITDRAEIDACVERVLARFGRIDVLVNNAGILRDRVVVNMTEAEWDGVIDVHMKGHFVPTRWAAAYWRERAKAGNEGARAIVNTASGAMLGNLGQFNYAGAKAAIAAMTLVAAQELGRYGVKVNCLAPIARTRMTLATPGLEDVVKAPEDGSFDKWDPANISPLVAYLSTAECPFTGGVFHVGGNEVGLYGGWSLEDDNIIATDGRWTVADLQTKAAKLAEGRDGMASVTTGLGDTFKLFGKRGPTG